MIKLKAKKINGEDIEIAVSDINTDVNVEVNLNDLARTEGIDPNLLATLTPEKLEALSAIADDDLAPPPSQEDIFGKVDAIKCQYQEDSEKISRQLKENQTRIENNLQNKIASRRQRRARKNLEEKESVAYKEIKEKGPKDKKEKDKKHKKDKKDNNHDTEDNIEA